MSDTISDLAGILCALVIWSVLCLGPGLVLGQISNVLRFRSRSLIRQLFLASVLSFAVMPVVYDWLALACGVDAAKYLNALVGVALLVLAATNRRGLRKRFTHLRVDFRANLAPLIAMLICILVGLVALLDFQFGDKLFISLAMHDHSHKIGVVDSILRNGLPPPNPAFYPGHPVPFFYHYYWSLLCAVIGKSTACGDDTRIIVLAGVLWTSLTLIATIAICADVMRSKVLSPRLLTGVALSLLLVSNLYILTDLPINLITHPPAIIDLVWWSHDGISPLFLNMIWLPHNVASLVSGVIGSILLLNRQDKNDFDATEKFFAKDRIVTAVLIGVSLASSLGLCFFVGFTFAVTWITWSCILFFKKSYRQSFYIAASCLIALCAIMPFILQFKGVGGGGDSSAAKLAAGSTVHKFPLGFGIRNFELIYMVPKLVPDKNSLAYQIVLFCLLPVNYFFGIGYTLTATFAQFRDKYVAHSKFDSRAIFATVFISVSVILASCVRSATGGNDFGWRSLLLAQFGMLMCAALYASRQLCLKRKFNWFDRAIISLGVASTFYGVYLDRSSMVDLFDAERVKSTREIYAQLGKLVPPDGSIQHNPTLTSKLPVEILALSYSHRRDAVTEKVLEIAGPQLADVDEYNKVSADIVGLFDKMSPVEAQKICARNKINVLLVKDTDKIWSDKSGWVWQFPVIAENKHARAVRVQNF